MLHNVFIQTDGEVKVDGHTHSRSNTDRPKHLQETYKEDYDWQGHAHPFPHTHIHRRSCIDTPKHTIENIQTDR